MKLIMCSFFAIGLALGVNAHASGDQDSARGLYGQNSPDFPLNKYVGGQPGVISPDYRPSYLIIAWRYLSNKPLSDREQANVLDVMGDYFTYKVQHADNEYKVDINQSNRVHAERLGKYQTANDEGYGYTWWEKNRALPLAERVQQTINSYPSSTKSFTKFKLASLRLASVFNELQLQKLPDEKTNVILQAWLNAQDALFANEYTDKTRYDVSIDGLTVLKSDIDYMTAASYFNSENEEKLLKSYELFTQLAKETQYPWHEWADYLSYRALTRAACQDFDSARPLPKQIELLNRAQAGLQHLASQAQDPAVKAAAVDYLNIVKGRVNPKAYIIELSRQMNQKITHENFFNVIFYNDILRWNEQFLDNPDALNQENLTEDSSDMLFWIINYTSKDSRKAFDTAYRLWQKTPDNQAWLLVALNNIKEADADQRTRLLQAAELVKPDQPGFFTIRSSLIQALSQLDKNSPESIRKRHALIDDSLAQLKPDEDFSTHMQFAKMGIPLANNVDNLLSYGFFMPSSSMLALYGANTSDANPWFSPLDFSQALNHLPLSVLAKLLESKQLPPAPQQELYASVWARAMLLGQYVIADRIAPKTMALNPALKSVIRSSYKVKNPDQRLKALVDALLYFPELSPIINLKSTWMPEHERETVYYGISARKIRWMNSYTYWCKGGEINRLVFTDQMDVGAPPIAWSSLLSPKQQAELDAEQTYLAALPDGASWLANQASELAKKFPKDKGNAERLALAVNATRTLACYTDGPNASQRAFVLLKRRYPDSDGAKRTKYYY